MRGASRSTIATLRIVKGIRRACPRSIRAKCFRGAKKPKSGGRPVLEGRGERGIAQNPARLGDCDGVVPHEHVTRACQWPQAPGATADGSPNLPKAASRGICKRLAVDCEYRSDSGSNAPRRRSRRERTACCDRQTTSARRHLCEKYFRGSARFSGREKNPALAFRHRQFAATMKLAL